MFPPGYPFWLWALWAGRQRGSQGGSLQEDHPIFTPVLRGRTVPPASPLAAGFDRSWAWCRGLREAPPKEGSGRTVMNPSGSSLRAPGSLSPLGNAPPRLPCARHAPCPPLRHPRSTTRTGQDSPGAVTSCCAGTGGPRGGLGLVPVPGVGCSPPENRRWMCAPAGRRGGQPPAVSSLMQPPGCSKRR